MNARINKEIQYKYIFDMVLHESKFAWNTASIFLLVNSLLAGFVINNYLKNEGSFTLIALVFGLIISLMWFSSLYRIKTRQGFWMAKAREFEKESKNNWFPIFSGDAETLANGGIVKADGNKFDLKILGIIHLPSQKALGIIISLFILFYIVVIFLEITN